MENEKILDGMSELEDYELAILNSKVTHLEKELEKNEQEKAINQQSEEELYAKAYAIASRKSGNTINDLDSFLDLPDIIKGEVYDELSDSEDKLIRPSHEYYKYSLIRKEPELRDYIPVQKTTGISSVLQHLNDRSTTRAFEIVKEQTSENTRLAQIGDLVYWQAWLSAIGFNFNEPITENEVLTFIIQHVEGLEHSIDQKLVAQRFKQNLGPHKISTVKRRIASLSVFLDLSNWPNPCRNKEIKIVLQKLTKKYGSSKPAGKAITKDILDDMLETCGDKLLDVRDKALLLFAWGSGGRRRAEVTAADMKDLVKTPEGDFVYTIPHSKTDQEGKGSPVPVKGRVAKALNDWLTASGITEGAIFRSIRKGDRIKGALSPVDVHRVVRNRLKKAGYDETQFGAHSLRSGFVTEAGRKGKALGDVMALTTHRNVETIMKYYQAGSIINNSAANLAD